MGEIPQDKLWQHSDVVAGRVGGTHPQKDIVSDHDEEPASPDQPVANRFVALAPLLFTRPRRIDIWGTSGGYHRRYELRREEKDDVNHLEELRDRMDAAEMGGQIEGE